jgi:hypothetical protein
VLGLCTYFVGISTWGRKRQRAGIGVGAGSTTSGKGTGTTRGGDGEIGVLADKSFCSIIPTLEAWFLYEHCGCLGITPLPHSRCARQFPSTVLPPHNRRRGTNTQHALSISSPTHAHFASQACARTWGHTIHCLPRGAIQQPNDVQCRPRPQISWEAARMQQCANALDDGAVAAFRNAVMLGGIACNARNTRTPRPIVLGPLC